MFETRSREVAALLLILWSVHNALGLESESLTEPQEHSTPLIEAASRTYPLSQAHQYELIRQSVPLFTNRTLVVCVVVREPFVNYEEPRKGDWLVGGGSNGSASASSKEERLEAEQDFNNYSGVAIEVIKRLQLLFKFKIRIIRPSDSQFGVWLPEKKRWTGIVGSLLANESDIGVSALSITVSRSQVIDFTRAYYVETGAILLRIPEEVQNYFAIVEPFSAGVWFVLLATIVVLIFLITIMTKLEEEQAAQHRLAKSLSRRAHQLGAQVESSASARLHSVSVASHQIGSAGAKKKLVKKKHETSWLERFYYATTCVLNILLIRDIREPPRQTPIRILVCVWWLSTMVIVNIYLGILFGQLVVPRRPRSIETLEELVGQQQVDWCVTRGSALDELFRRSPADSVYGQLGRRMRPVNSADEGVARVLSSGWAFIRERSMLTFKVAKEHNKARQCRLQLAKAEFFSVGFGLALRKRSPYLRAFNAALTLMIENGFLSHWQSLYWPQRNRFTECKPQALREGEPLSMKHFISIYLISSSALLVSLAVLGYQNISERVSAFRASK